MGRTIEGSQPIAAPTFIKPNRLKPIPRSPDETCLSNPPLSLGPALADSSVWRRPMPVASTCVTPSTPAAQKSQRARPFQKDSFSSLAASSSPLPARSPSVDSPRPSAYGGFIRVDFLAIDPHTPNFIRTAHTPQSAAAPPASRVAYRSVSGRLSEIPPSSSLAHPPRLSSIRPNNPDCGGGVLSSTHARRHVSVASRVGPCPFLAWMWADRERGATHTHTLNFNRFDDAPRTDRAD